MKIKSINIKNFKSIVDITINEPNPFTVFVGPNGSGKSNIFEALEYRLTYENTKLHSESFLISDIFPNILNNNIERDTIDINFENQEKSIQIKPQVEFDLYSFKLLSFGGLYRYGGPTFDENGVEERFFHFEKQLGYQQFVQNHSEIFIGNFKREKISVKSDRKLSTSCDNLEKVLKRILQNPVLREEILDYLRMLVPELENIEIVTDEIDGDSKLRIYEKFSKKPFNKALISDGTYNILCLLTAVYQSEEPQFLCIEEPENGLSPYAIETLVGLFRSHCQDYGHYIWLNTHSQTLVRNLKPEEFILVDKIEGETKIKQFKNEDLEGWRMDEAWLTNALGGGLPW